MSSMMLIQRVSGLEHMVNRPGCFSIEKVAHTLNTSHMLTLLQQSGFDFKFTGIESQEVITPITPKIKVSRTVDKPPMEVTTPDGNEMLIRWEDIPKLFHEYGGPFVVETHFKQKLYRLEDTFDKSWPRAEMRDLIRGMVFSSGSLNFSVLDTPPAIYRLDSLILNTFKRNRLPEDIILIGLFDKELQLKEVCDILWFDGEDLTLKPFYLRQRILNKLSDRIHFKITRQDWEGEDVFVTDPEKPYVSFGGQWIVSKLTTPKVLLHRNENDFMVLGEDGYAIPMNCKKVFTPMYSAEILVDKNHPFDVKQVLTKRDFARYYDYRGVNIYRFSRRFVEA